MFNNGVDVATAVVVFRSALPATIPFWCDPIAGGSVRFDALTPRQRRFVPLDYVLDRSAKLTIYSSVARLPVALALPVQHVSALVLFWDRVLYGKHLTASMLIAMPIIPFGLALALPVRHWASARRALGEDRYRCRLRACGSSAVWPAMILTQHEITALDGFRVRFCTTPGMAAPSRSSAPPCKVACSSPASDAIRLDWPRAVHVALSAPASR